jgi:hypothetical protein
MPTDKKNQHYLPKFYLRNFSYKDNKKEVGIYNIRKKFYYQTAPLKTQGSKTFFYGEDGQIENALSVIESILSKEIHELVKTRKLPEHNTDGHKLLLQFMALTHLRNPIAIEGIKNSRKAVKEKILEMDPNAKVDDFIPEPTHEEAIAMSLSTVNEIVDIISDLDYKLLVNKTDTKFISSDLPVVRYNQFLEYKKWNHGKTGYGNMGLQIFIPLSPELTIMFYDNKTYKVGDKKHKILELKNDKDIDKLNQLQYLNSLETLFFGEQTTKHYIENLIKNSSKYKKANQTSAELSFIVSPKTTEKEIKEKKENLIIVENTDCTTNLEIEGIKMLSGVRLRKLSNSMAQLREKPLEWMKNNR